MTFALPLCLPHLVEAAFELFEEELAHLGSPNAEELARNYIFYIRETYMSRSYGTPGSYEWNF